MSRTPLRSVARALGAPLVLSLTASLIGATAFVPAQAEGLLRAGALGSGALDAGLSSPVEDSYYPSKGDPGVDALRYRLDLDWRRGPRVLVGTATVRFRATQDAPRFQLDLHSRLTVRSVTVDGSPAPFEHVGNHLVVSRALSADSRHTARISYRGTPGTARGPASRPDVARLGMRVTKDGQLWTMQEPFGAFTWYPVNDHPSDKALYAVRVSAPGRWVGVSNGRLLSRRRVDGRTVTRWSSSHPTASYLVTLAVGPYRVYRQTGPGDLPLSYWVPRSRPELVKPLLTTPAAMRWLGRRLGRYPFDTAGIVVTPGGSAMETQTMVTFGARLYRHGRFYVRSTVVHEMAHHWYGNTVTPTDWRDLWMNEGMATYLDARWQSEHSDFLMYRWGNQVSSWAWDDQWLRDMYGPPGAYARDEFASANVYFSAALMWDRLRRKVGNATFDRLVRAWPQAHRDASSSREELVDWWETRTDRELSRFFTRWLTSEESPARP